MPEYQDSAGIPIGVGDRVRHRGNEYTIARFVDGMGSLGCAGIVFEEDPPGPSADEITVDKIETKTVRLYSCSTHGLNPFPCPASCPGLKSGPTTHQAVYATPDTPLPEAFQALKDAADGVIDTVAFLGDIVCLCECEAKDHAALTGPCAGCWRKCVEICPRFRPKDPEAAAARLDELEQIQRGNFDDKTQI